MMSTVANHINEMQRVCEAYQLVFESMLKSSQITEVRLAVHCSTGRTIVFFVYVGSIKHQHI